MKTNVHLTNVELKTVCLTHIHSTLTFPIDHDNEIDISYTKRSKHLRQIMS